MDPIRKLTLSYNNYTKIIQNVQFTLTFVYEFYSYYKYSSQQLKDNLTASILLSYISSVEEMIQDNLHYSDSCSSLPSLKPLAWFSFMAWFSTQAIQK